MAIVELKIGGVENILFNWLSVSAPFLAIFLDISDSFIEYIIMPAPLKRGHLSSN